MSAQPVEQQDQEDAACAVDRQIRSHVYAPVHKGVGSHQIEQHFPEPAGEGGCEEQQCIVVKWTDVFSFHDKIRFPLCRLYCYRIVSPEKVRIHSRKSANGYSFFRKTVIS